MKSIYDLSSSLVLSTSSISWRHIDGSILKVLSPKRSVPLILAVESFNILQPTVFAIFIVLFQNNLILNQMSGSNNTMSHLRNLWSLSTIKNILDKSIN